MENEQDTNQHLNKRFKVLISILFLIAILITYFKSQFKYLDTDYNQVLKKVHLKKLLEKYT